MESSAKVDMASKMLANALEEMDEIISGVSSIKSSQSSPDDKFSSSSVVSAAQNLAYHLQQHTGSTSTYIPDNMTLSTISRWLENQMPRSESSDERYRQLQVEKDALAFQIQILSEQVNLQNEKINELERLLNEKNRLIANAEDILQREMLARSSLETKKLELLSTISELNLRNAALEHENREFRLKLLSTFALHQAGNSSNPQRVIERQILLRGDGSLGNLKASPMHRSYGSLITDANISGHNSSKTPPPDKRNHVNYSSLPRQIIHSTGRDDKEKKNVAFSDTKKIIESGSDHSRSSTPQASSFSSPSSHKKAKGFKVIFGKIKRSGSGNLEDLPPNDNQFMRGGVRATAGPRLQSYYLERKTDKPFNESTTDDICAWLHELGLEIYIESAKRWLRNGVTDLLAASSEKIEKELNIKSPLHTKKILLAIAYETGAESDESFKSASKCDNNWVLRWLEDIGLPQYKDSFFNARVDGRVLHRLTFDDLSLLQMSSCLHIASLRRGIQLMRMNKWNDEQLIRRTSIETNDYEKVHLWTAHRVWDWLRCVDLAEYAPNLRGAGVHGALMILEPRFTATLLADLLSIPASKTLLRRHLNTHFKELLGMEIIQAKREFENTLGYQPLTLYSKIKKKAPFSSLMRKKSFKGSIKVDENTDLVCPIGDLSDNDHIPDKHRSSNDRSRGKTIGCLSSP